MNKQQKWVYYAGEVHGINAGWRLTEVEVGRKWVYLRVSGKPRRKVRRVVYEDMATREVEQTS